MPTPHTFAVELGKVYRDDITDFEGKATSAMVCISGCDRICLEPKVKEGEPALPEAAFFDDHRLIDVETGRHVIEREEDKKPGGPVTRGRPR